MRWSNLTVETEERAQLPGYRDGAVVRHFEAPGAISTRFYEVRAKSILNRVPAASQMPFRWTINPFRGCTHACAYCTGPETAVMLADGRTKAIADVAVGERIYGTERRGHYRRFVTTEVLDKWSSIKPAYAVELEDGTVIIASGEHRFLSARGWKHVSGTEHGRLRRPHVTINSKLLGPGGHVSAPEHDRDYQRGYLCGVIRGDGSLGSYDDPRPGQVHGTVHRFRLALTDREALDRSRAFLVEWSINTSEFVFLQPSQAHREMTAIRTHSGHAVDRIRELIQWPILPSVSWIKGFLAGIFDAGGGCNQGVWRIANCDREIIDWVVMCLRRFGFTCVIERPTERLMCVRMTGGLSQRMRFFNLTDPAISRKRSIEGAAVKTVNGCAVVAIRPLGMVIRMYDITTGTGDFIADGVISHNCFARPTHTYLDFDAGRDFEREIVVKVNAPELVRAELAKPSWKGEHVALGTNTDPYQWVEGRYRLMPGIWEAMRDARNPCSVLTKSPLLLRDLKLMKEINARTEFSAALSVPTLDEKAWRATEPHTPSPRARMEAVAELVRSGIRTGVLIAPLMPGINDAPEQVEEILRLADEAGAEYVTGIALHLRADVRRLFFDWLRDHRPELVPRYERLYRRGAYAPPEERQRLTALLKARPVGKHGPEAEDSDWMRRGGRLARVETPPERQAPEQQHLF